MTKNTDDKIKELERVIRELQDWQIKCSAEKGMISNLVNILRQFGPWALVFLFVLFEHKLKLL